MSLKIGCIIRNRSKHLPVENVIEIQQDLKCTNCQSTKFIKEKGYITCLNCGLAHEIIDEDTTVEFDEVGHTNCIFTNNSAGYFSPSLDTSVPFNNYSYREKQLLHIYHKLTTDGARVFTENVVHHCMKSFNEILAIGKTQRGKNVLYDLWYCISFCTSFKANHIFRRYYKCL